MIEIEIDRFAVEHAHGELVIDVREPAEYVDGHVPGARLVPMKRLGVVADALPIDRPIYVICASGNRSKSAAIVLRSRGLDAYSVAGGTSAWAAAGHAVVTGPRAYAEKEIA